MPSPEPVKAVAPRIAALPPTPPAEVTPAKSVAARSAHALAAHVYWVQFRVFKSAEAAMKFAAGFADPKLTLEPGPGLGWRALVGPFTQRATAQSKARELGKHGYSTQIHEAPRE